MKRMHSLILPFLFFAILTVSCDKTKEEIPGEKFSTASVEENKATVEQAGVEFVTTMSDMKSIQTVDVLVNFGDLMSSMGGKKASFSKESKLLSTLAAFTSTANGEKTTNDLFKAMASSEELGEGPQSIKEAWDSIVGTYTWTPSMNDWKVDRGGNKAEFLFPSSSQSLTNDAVLTISNYSGVTIANNPMGDDYTGDFPANLNLDLKVGNTVLVTFVFGASYNTDGVPKAIAADLTIESYKFELDVANTNQVASVNYKFLANNKVVMDMGVSGEGLFTKANVDANTHTVTKTDTWGYYDYVYNSATGGWDQVWVTQTNTWEESQTDFEEILHSASAHFQLFDIAIRGDIDVKGLVDEINKIDDQIENETITTPEGDSLAAIQINKYLNLRLVDLSNGLIIAKAQAYAKKEIITEYSESYTRSSIDFKLTFADGSPIDAETYFNSGFDNFIDEVNNLINDLNTEYDLGIEVITKG